MLILSLKVDSRNNSYEIQHRIPQNISKKPHFRSGQGLGDQVNTPSRLTNKNIIVALVIDVEESVTLQNTTDAQGLSKCTCLVFVVVFKKNNAHLEGKESIHCQHSRRKVSQSNFRCFTLPFGACNTTRQRAREKPIHNMRHEGFTS